MPAVKPRVPGISETQARAIVEEHQIETDAHHTWPLIESNIPAAIARDTEVTADIAAHTAIAAAHHARYTDAEVDTIVAAHTAIAAAHHTRYTDAEATTQADAKITTECGAGQTIDNAIDALVATHAGDVDAHHNPVTLSAQLDDLISVTTQLLDLLTQTANLVLAGPSAGGAAKPTFRALVEDDMPANVVIKDINGGIHVAICHIQDHYIYAQNDTFGLYTPTYAYAHLVCASVMCADLGASNAWTGTFTNGDGDTVTVTGGIITNIS